MKGIVTQRAPDSNPKPPGPKTNNPNHSLSWVHDQEISKKIAAHPQTPPQTIPAATPTMKGIPAYILFGKGLGPGVCSSSVWFKQRYLEVQDT